MNERRIESRFLCADLVKVNWLVGEDDFQTAEAVLEDISQLGACIQVEQQVPQGTKVTISMGETRYYGYVSYCVYRDYGYFVGILWADGTQWSSGGFQPRHLINIEELAHEAGEGSESLTRRIFRQLPLQ
jgi:hypothetical protein